MENTPVVRTETHLVASDASSVLTALMDKAVEAKMDPAGLEKLFGLYERMQSMNARQAFTEAMAKFKVICPAIPRGTINNQFKVVNRDGVTVPRRYAALDDIEKTIRNPLGECGLSYRWTGCKVEGEQLSMECVVSHIGGHSESSPVTLPVKSGAGCSEAQRYGSAMTYAQRFSLIQALGLTTCDEDTDGADDVAPVETITESQAVDLEAGIKEVGGNMAAFLKKFGVSSIRELPKSQLAAAGRMIEEKRAAR